MASRNDQWQGRKWLRDDKRLAIFLRDGLRCLWCNRGIEDAIIFTIDHAKPVTRKGSNHAKNLLTSCRNCNSKRRHDPLSVFAMRAACGFAPMTTRHLHEMPGIEAGAKAILARISRCRRRSLRTYRVKAKLMLEGRKLTDITKNPSSQRQDCKAWPKCACILRGNHRECQSNNLKL